jgi:hypothetical protein
MRLDLFVEVLLVRTSFDTASFGCAMRKAAAVMARCTERERMVSASENVSAATSPAGLSAAARAFDIGLQDPLDLGVAVGFGASVVIGGLARRGDQQRHGDTEFRQCFLVVARPRQARGQYCTGIHRAEWLGPNDFVRRAAKPLASSMPSSSCQGVERKNPTLIELEGLPAGRLPVAGALIGVRIHFSGLGVAILQLQDGGKVHHGRGQGGRVRLEANLLLNLERRSDEALGFGEAP